MDLVIVYQLNYTYNVDTSLKFLPIDDHCRNGNIRGTARSLFEPEDPEHLLLSLEPATHDGPDSNPRASPSLSPAPNIRLPQVQNLIRSTF